LRCDRLLGEHGLGKARYRVEFSRRTEAERGRADDLTQKKLRQGWLYGADDFVIRLIDRLEKSETEHYRAKERRETDEELADRIVHEGMKELGWSEEELSKRRKSDRAKVRLALQLRRRTAVNLKWIARRLGMGSWSNVANLLRQESAKSAD
jgi:hypothetical protein